MGNFIIRALFCIAAWFLIFMAVNITIAEIESRSRSEREGNNQFCKIRLGEQFSYLPEIGSSRALCADLEGKEFYFELLHTR